MKCLKIIILSLLFFSCKTAENKALKKEITALKEKITELQTDTLHIGSALELKSMNVVYRGVRNAIKISTSNSKLIEVTAPGLKKIDNKGNYELSPQSGKSVDVTITSLLKNNDTLTEVKTLRIKNLSRMKSLFNNRECYRCELPVTKKELSNGNIRLKPDDFIFDLNIEINGFSIKFPKSNVIEIKGNKIPEKLKPLIEALNSNDIVQVFNIQSSIKNKKYSRIRYCKISPIILKIKALN